MSLLSPSVLALAALFLGVLGFFTVRTVLFTGTGTLLLRTRLAQGRRVYRRPYAPGQLRSELLAAVRVLLFDAAVVVVLKALDLDAYAPASPGVTALTFLVLFVWFEVWFYATHRLLHTRALYFIHAQHHTAKVTHPLSSMSFSLLERALLTLGLVGAAIALSHVMPISAAGLGLYYLFNYAFNVLGHLNVELYPARFARSWLGRVHASTTFHAMHHARYTGHYGLITVVLDRWLGTAWEDYPEVQARAARGEGLERLGERLPTPPAAPPAAPAAPAAT